MSSAATDRFSSLSERYIGDLEGFDAFADSLASRDAYEVCGVDAEADSMHSYATKLCLVQFAVPDELAIIDPLAIGIDQFERFTGFIDRFATVWMHGADYDISLFKMTFGWAPRRILDTQIAARFLGVRKFGLANLLEQEYGIQVSKQSQKADWSKRPLSEKMQAYAFNDVRYLLDLGERFQERLLEKGRWDWFLETCDAALRATWERDEKSEDEVWRISGWGKLSRAGLNYLRHLWYWRDEECRRLDRPAFKFLGNRELLGMARTLEAGGRVDVPKHLRANRERRLRQAIEAAQSVPEAEYPAKRLRSDGVRLDVDESRLGRIREHRDAVARDLGVEPTLIATRHAMERLAARNLDAEEKVSPLISWQRSLMEPWLDG